MENRRSFLKKSALASLSAQSILSCDNDLRQSKKEFPRIISTWNHGLAANKKAWEVLKSGSGGCLLYTSPSPRDATLSRMPSSA